MQCFAAKVHMYLPMNSEIILRIDGVIAITQTLTLFITSASAMNSFHLLSVRD